MEICSSPLSVLHLYLFKVRQLALESECLNFTPSESVMSKRLVVFFPAITAKKADKTRVSLLICDTCFVQAKERCKAEENQAFRLFGRKHGKKFDPELSWGQEETEHHCTGKAAPKTTASFYNALDRAPKSSLNFLHLSSMAPLKEHTVETTLHLLHVCNSFTIAIRVALVQRTAGEDVTEKVAEDWCRASLGVHLISSFCLDFFFFSVHEAPSDMPLITKEGSA